VQPPEDALGRLLGARVPSVEGAHQRRGQHLVAGHLTHAPVVAVLQELLHNAEALLPHEVLPVLPQRGVQLHKCRHTLLDVHPLIKKRVQRSKRGLHDTDVVVLEAGQEALDGASLEEVECSRRGADSPVHKADVELLGHVLLAIIVRL
jgi:hypothetical protein